MGRGGADALLVIGLARGMSVSEAAAFAGVSHTTVDRRLRKPEFREQVDVARVELVRGVVDRLTAAACDATDRLVELLSHEDPKIGLDAAKTILGYLPAMEAASRLADERVRHGEPEEYANWR